MNKTSFTPRHIAVMAMFSAIAFITVVFSEFIPKVEGFLSYEPKDSVVVIAGLLFGPVHTVIIAFIVSFIEMITISATGPIGFLMNVISTCAFALPASMFYRKNRTQKGAVIGLCIGVVCMTAAMLLWNYIITPLYMNVDRSTVVAMLIPVFLPFNLLKGGLNAGLTLLLYKPVVTALRATHLVEPSNAQTGKARFSAGFFIISLVILVSLVLAFLAFAGVF